MEKRTANNSHGGSSLDKSTRSCIPAMAKPIEAEACRRRDPFRELACIAWTTPHQNIRGSLKRRDATNSCRDGFDTQQKHAAGSRCHKLLVDAGHVQNDTERRHIPCSAREVGRERDHLCAHGARVLAEKLDVARIESAVAVDVEQRVERLGERGSGRQVRADRHEALARECERCGEGPEQRGGGHGAPPHDAATARRCAAT
eukprot:6192128-Pleurochrysis_carterae.AAC.1